MSRTTLSLSVIFILFLGTASFAQGGGSEAPPPRSDGEQRDGLRRGLLGQLDLTPEQMEKIRIINRGRRTAMFEAMAGLRDANRLLDEAIYEAEPSEEKIKSRIEAVREAQGALIKVRSMTEFEIRKVLTPEQLNKFREARRRFGDPQRAAPREEMRPGGRPGAMRPGRRQRPPNRF